MFILDVSKPISKRYAFTCTNLFLHYSDTNNCYVLLFDAFFFLPFFFRVCKHNLHLLIACMTMILPTQVQAPHQSWKHLLRIELNLKIRAYLSALNYN